MKALMSFAVCLVAAAFALAAAAALTGLYRLPVERAPSVLMKDGKLDPRLPLFFRT